MKMLVILMVTHTVFASTPHVVWNETFDFGADDLVTDLVIDPTGDLCGGGYTVGQDGMGDFCLVKYTSGGIKMWDTIYDGGADERAEGLGVDASGNIYIAGTSFDGPQQDYLIVKYDTDGNQLWDVPYHHAYDRAYGATADATGNVYVTGESLDSGSGYLTVKYSSDGDFVWDKLYKSSPSDQGYDVCVDADGNVYVVGRILDGDIFNCHIIIYDSGGNEKSHIDYDFGLNDLIHGISSDLSGNIYVTGCTQSTQTNRFVTAKFNPGGSLEWEVSRNAGSFDAADAIAVDSSGNVYIAGTAGGDFITIKYDPEGNLMWEKIFDGGDQDQASGIGVDDSGFVYVAGTSMMGGSADFRIIKYEEVEEVTEERAISGPLDVRVSYIVSASPRFFCIMPDGNSGKLVLFSPDGCRIREYDVSSSSTVVWDGFDNKGRQVGSGVYHALLTSGSYTSLTKVILQR